MWTYLLAMLVISHEYKITTQQCTPDTSLPVPNTISCSRDVNIVTNIKPSTCSYSCKEGREPNFVKWENLFANGRVNAHFLLPDTSCNHTGYNIQLRINETLTQEQCEKAEPDQFNDTHTRRKYSLVNQCSNDTNCLPCNETGIVSFKYVFTGCYRLRLQPDSNGNIQKTLWSCPVFLKSDYKKQPLTDYTPTYELSYRSELMKLRGTIDYEPLFCDKLNIALTLIQIIDNRNCTGAMYGNKMHSHCTTYGVNEINETMNCDSNRTSCKRNGKELDCFFDGITPGNYCVYTDIFDDRCDAGTIWKQECKWNYRYTAESGPSSVQSTPFSGSVGSYVLAGCLLVIAVMLASVGVWGVCRLTRPTPPCQGGVAQTVFTPVGSDILLLYARDCPPFMRLMSSLRRLLQKASSNNVYDCFDSEYWAEVSADSLSWIRQKTQRRNVKIVLVATKCAKLRYQALSTSFRLRYRDPGSLDSLFLAALKDIQESPPLDVYARVYVVRFQDFTDDTDLFANLNSYTRFVLPVHLSALLDQLTRLNLADHQPQLAVSEEWTEFHKNIKELITYTSQNTNYLQNMLIVDSKD